MLRTCVVIASLGVFLPAETGLAQDAGVAAAPEVVPPAVPEEEADEPAEPLPPETAPAETGPDVVVTPDAAALAAPTTPDPAVDAPEEEEEAPAIEPITLAWGQGLTARTDDGAFTLQIRGRLQAQASLVSPLADGNAGDPVIDFMARRLRLLFRGTFITSSLEYYVQFGFAPRDMEPDLLIPLRDAQLAWTGLRDLSIRVGVMKAPFSRERVISSSSLQLVDRSIVNAELSLDRDNGIQLYSRDLFGLGGYLGYQLGVFGGDGRLRVNGDSGLLYVARVEVQPFGRFEDAYSEVDFTRAEQARLSIGVGGAYNDDTPRQRSTTGGRFELGGIDYLHFEADLIFKYAGFSLQAEVLYRQNDGPVERTGMIDGELVTERARNALGWFVQAGYLFGFAPVELAARFADIHPLGILSGTSRQREITVGLSWYPMEHNLKLQLDASYLGDETIASDGTRTPTERFQARLQVQAYF
jgi:phosphate-selective porin OprO and OprP